MRMSEKKRITVLAVIITGFALNALSFDDVLINMPGTIGVLIAELQSDHAFAEYRSLTYPGDPTLSVQPSISMVTPEEGDFAERIGISATLSFSAPLGLPDSRQTAISAAAAEIDASERALEYAETAVYADLMLRYLAALSSQILTDVILQETEAARAAEGVARMLYESGRISLSDLLRAEDTLGRLEADLIEAELKERLKWLDLAYAADLDPVETAELLPVGIDLGELPKPPELTEWAWTHSESVLNQLEKIRRIEEDIELLMKTDFTASVKTSLSAFSHSASLNYNVESATLSGSYTPPSFVFGNNGAASEDGSWSMGLSVALSFGGDEADQRRLEADEFLLAQAKAELELLKEEIALNVRAGYQAVLIGDEAVEQAAKSLEKSADFYRLVSDRFDRGQVTESELLTAGAALARMEYQLNQAEADVIEAKLRLAQNASYLSEYLGKGVRE